MAIDIITSSGSGTGTGADEVLILAADTDPVNNSTTLVNVSGMSWTVAANEIWEVEGRLFYSSGTTPDFKFSFSVPSGADMRASARYLNVDGSTHVVWTYGIDLTANVSVGGVGISTVAAYVFSARLAISATPGTVQLQFAQNTANASDTTLLSGSSILGHKPAA